MTTFSEYEELERQKHDQINNFNEPLFVVSFSESSWFLKLKTLSESDQNILYLYRILNLTCGDPATNKRLIQDCIYKAFAYCNFTTEEIVELRSIFTDNCFCCLFNIPDDEWISSGYKWDIQYDRLISPPPGNSWYFDDGKWHPPVPHPEDGNLYDWNENAYQSDTANPKTAGWVTRT